MLLFSVSLTAQEKAILNITQLDSAMAVNPKPVVMLLSTEWCKYCKMQKAMLQNDKSLLTGSVYFIEFDAESKGDITFNGKKYSYKPNGLNTGVHELAVFLASQKDKVMSYPTWMVLDENYTVVYRYSGVMQADGLKELFEAASKS